MSIPHLFKSFRFCQHLNLFYHRNNVLPLYLSKFRSRQLSDVSPKTEENNSLTEYETKKSISSAMKAYLQRSVEHEKFMSEKVIEYEIGKRHLANMMGENPETFTQDDIDEAIKYLFPSGLFEPRARPYMKHPAQIFAETKEALFDANGRPFHSLFYTGKYSYYSLLQQIAIIAIKFAEATNTQSDLGQFDSAKFFEGSKWVDKVTFEDIIGQSVTDQMFEHFIKAMERLMRHPLASGETEFFSKYREKIIVESLAEDVPELMYTEDGVPYMTAKSRRKTADANVCVYGRGSGKFRVNGEDILYFESRQDREQIMFPLQFTENLSSVDIEATVEGGGKSGQAGAIRHAIALALRSFVSESMNEKMRIAGLISQDIRWKERKKPGQKRARKKFTWKKR